jgi:hypothetical protein
MWSGVVPDGLRPGRVSGFPGCEWFRGVPDRRIASTRTRTPPGRMPLHPARFIRARYVLLSRTCTGRRVTLERAGSAGAPQPAYTPSTAPPRESPVHDHQHPGRAVGHRDRRVRLLGRNPPTRASIEEGVPVSVSVVTTRARNCHRSVASCSASPTGPGSVREHVLPANPVRALQHALYRVAKADPGRRFRAPMDKVRAR